MTKCPLDEMCDPVKEHHETLFGENGLKNQIVKIKLNMKDFVTKKSVWGTFLSCLFIILIVTGFILDLWATTREISKIVPRIEIKIEDHESKILINRAEISSFRTQQAFQTILLKQIASKLEIGERNADIHNNH